VAVEAEGLFFLETRKRIFLGQSSRHVRTEVSLLYDENGRLVTWRVSATRTMSG